jgi:hypothetical protein
VATKRIIEKYTENLTTAFRDSAVLMAGIGTN